MTNGIVFQNHFLKTFLFSALFWFRLWLPIPGTIATSTIHFFLLGVFHLQPNFHTTTPTRIIFLEYESDGVTPLLKLWLCLSMRHRQAPWCASNCPSVPSPWVTLGYCHIELPCCPMLCEATCLFRMENSYLSSNTAQLSPLPTTLHRYIPFQGVRCSVLCVPIAICLYFHFNIYRVVFKFLKKISLSLLPSINISFRTRIKFFLSLYLPRAIVDMLLEANKHFVEWVTEPAAVFYWAVPGSWCEINITTFSNVQKKSALRHYATVAGQYTPKTNAKSYLLFFYYLD